MKLSSRRPTTCCQNQPLASDNCSISLTEENATPATTGTKIDHRNGLERTKLETSNSQPSDGSAHSALNGISTINLIHNAIRCVGDHNGSGFMPWNTMNRLMMMRKTRCSAITPAIASAGA